MVFDKLVNSLGKYQSFAFSRFQLHIHSWVQNKVYYTYNLRIGIINNEEERTRFFNEKHRGFFSVFVKDVKLINKSYVEIKS